MKAVYGYMDFRLLLRDYYEHHKKRTPGFTYARFSKMANLKSANYMKLIIEGDRNLTIANIHGVAAALELSRDELRYFEALVLMNQAHGPKEERFYRERLDEIRHNKPTSSLKMKMNEFISHWYYPAVLVSIAGRSREDAPEAVSRLTGLPRLHVNKVIEIILREGLVRLENGSYALGDRHVIYHDKKLMNAIQKNFLGEQLDQSMRAFRSQYDKGAKFFAHTFTIAEGNFTAYVDRIRSFLESLSAQSDLEAADRVVQLNMQFFPLVEDPSQPPKPCPPNSTQSI